MPKSSKRQKRKSSHGKSTRSTYVIFLSHSSYDNWIAKVMSEKLQAIGADCWLDEKDLEGGDVIADEILRGIDICEEAIVLVSSNSANSHWVSFEIGAARAQHKRVTPILNNVKPSEMPPIQDIKGFDLNKFEQFLAQLRRRIARSRKA